MKLLQLFKYTSDENAAVQFIYYHDDYDDLDVLETDEEFNAMTRITIDYRVDQKKCTTFTKCRLHLLANPTTHCKSRTFFLVHPVVRYPTSK